MKDLKRSSSFPDNFNPAKDVEAGQPKESAPEKQASKEQADSSETSKATFSHHLVEHPVQSHGWGKGIVADFQRTVGTHWKEEMTNLNSKTVAVSFFLFFACIAPAITFGAIYEKATHNWIGAVEMIAATAWCGIVYAFLGGQPMMINGGTGPVLAFTEILFKMSESLDIPFLTFNAWIGLWVAFFMILAGFFNLNRIIVYATRFTDEIFALLIAYIFIINALGNPFADVGVYYYFESDHKSHDEHEDDPDYSFMASALLSLLVCIGTVQLALSLRKIKFSPFLPNQQSRNLITDFAVVLSIVLMTLVANVLFDDVETETLNVPETFAPTYACCTSECISNWPTDCPELGDPVTRRSWLVNLGDLNGKGWVPFLAAGPAILAFILVFLDDGITWHLINHPTHKLTHGEAYNYDTVVIGGMIAVNSILGLPWLVAATVRSLNHVHAMAERSPDGKIVSVQETRLTHLCIHLLCLASIFALDVLKLIPVPVLYGVFLFMGLVSLGTNQLWCRFMMFFMQPSKYPVEPYTQHVSTRQVHKFTAIQMGIFVLLYCVKAIKTIAIAFPLIIAACIPVRLYLLPKIFTEEELIMIDSDDGTIQAYLDRIQTKELSSGDLVEGSDDHITPLPSAVAKQTCKSNRRKTRSCPVGGTMFDSTEIVVLTTHDGESVIRQNIQESDEFDANQVGEAEDKVGELQTMDQARRRRKRHKSVSCPAHMLFAKAEQHVNANYFFG